MGEEQGFNMERIKKGLEDLQYLEDAVDNFLSLDLEYRLTVARRHNCKCAGYFILRREVLFPVLLKKANNEHLDAADVMADYARKVHQHLCLSPATVIGRIGARTS